MYNQLWNSSDNKFHRIWITGNITSNMDRNVAVLKRRRNSIVIFLKRINCIESTKNVVKLEIPKTGHDCWYKFKHKITRRLNNIKYFKNIDAIKIHCKPSEHGLRNTREF